MNILGCLDKPDAGTYRVAGEPTGAMSADELSRLRREHFGFIFQRYQLLDDLSALRNVEMPAIYAGVPTAERHARATTLLTRLGLAGRLAHRPNELSGGQQQRVSIARALINGGQVILADEPTGALDSESSAEVLRILQELNAQGHTVIIVTHDAAVAAHAHRVIELRDGIVVVDRAASSSVATTARPLPAEHDGSRLIELLNHAAEAAFMAARNMAGHRMRTLLTMLGIVIGIASVVSVSALGEGSRRELAAQLATLGTNTIDLNPGRGSGDLRAGTRKPLTAGDAKALAELDYIDGVSPVVSTNVTVRRGNVERGAAVRGVGAQHFHVRGFPIIDGRSFDERAVASQSQDAVIDEQTRLALFPDGSSPLGQSILIGSVPVRVVGVVQRPKSPFFDNGLAVYVPYTTALSRLSGASALSTITMRVKDGVSTLVAEGGITALLKKRHGSLDFLRQQHRSLSPDPCEVGGRAVAAGVVDRADLARRRRHRRHEHHAGDGQRAHAGDRHPDGRRRASRRHPASIPDRGRPRLHPRRRRRHRAGARHLGRVRRLRGVGQDAGLDEGRRRGLPRLDRHRRPVRLHAGAQGVAAESDRGVGSALSGDEAETPQSRQVSNSAVYRRCISSVDTVSMWPPSSHSCPNGSRTVPERSP